MKRILMLSLVLALLAAMVISTAAFAEAMGQAWRWYLRLQCDAGPIGEGRTRAQGTQLHRGRPDQIKPRPVRVSQ
jgi:hypothetical protein